MDQLLHDWIEKIASWVDSSQWKRFKATKNSVAKIMIFIFLDELDALFDKGETIGNEYYIALLDRLNEEIKKKVHKTIIKLTEMHFQLLDYPVCSPNLATSDLWLFTCLKRMF